MIFSDISLCRNMLHTLRGIYIHIRHHLYYKYKRNKLFITHRNVIQPCWGWWLPNNKLSTPTPEGPAREMDGWWERRERRERERERDKRKERKKRKNKEKTTHLFTYYSFIIVIYSCIHRGCSWHNVFLSPVKCVSTNAQKFNSWPWPSCSQYQNAGSFYS